MNGAITVPENILSDEAHVRPENPHIQHCSYYLLIDNLNYFIGFSRCKEQKEGTWNMG
jgi:hypothetical protein